ncbi:4113_t:CDS:2, partial [Acaulospora colombiana]
KSKKPNTTCENCKKKGHTKQDCWAKGGDKEGQGPKQKKGKDRANMADESEDTPLFDLALMASNSTQDLNTKPNNGWWLDSCANQHLCYDKSLFWSLEPANDMIKGVGGGTEIKGIGKVILEFENGDETRRVQISNVRYTPNCKYNLISMVAPRHPIANVADKSSLTWDEWHRRFGHIAISSLEILKKHGLVIGLEVDETSKPSKKCEACIQAKITRKPFPQESDRKTERPGDLTYSDVWGPARVESLGKSKYYISFTDHHTRRRTILFLKKKDEAFTRITQYLSLVETKFGYRPKAIRFDNGKELINKQMDEWCKAKGIEIEPTAPYSPSQNG